MNLLLLGLSFSLICYLNGLQEENNYVDKESVDLEALPLDKLLKMKKELRKRDDHPARRMATMAAAATTTDDVPNAMALRRQTDGHSGPTAGSSVQTAFQMSLTVLSFLAFGGYVISLVAQNARRPQQNDGMTAPQPLKTVVVNQQNRRPLRPTTTAITFGRRKRSRRSTPRTSPSRHDPFEGAR